MRNLGGVLSQTVPLTPLYNAHYQRSLALYDVAGSITDFDSVCLGSNPSGAAIFGSITQPGRVLRQRKLSNRVGGSNPPRSFAFVI